MLEHDAEFSLALPFELFFEVYYEILEERFHYYLRVRRRQQVLPLVFVLEVLLLHLKEGTQVYQICE